MASAAATPRVEAGPPRRPSLPAHTRLLGSLTAALVCAALVVDVAAKGAADAFGKLAHLNVSALERSGQARTEAYVGALDLAERALRMDPGNPHLAQLMAVTRMRSVAREDAEALWTRTALTQAVEDLRAAQAARPGWPYGAALLAAGKFRLGQEDAELSRALTVAGRQGGAEPQVFRLVTEIGLRAWENLDPPATAATTAALARLARTEPDRLDGLLRATGRAATGCAALGAAGEAVSICGMSSICPAGPSCDGG